MAAASPATKPARWPVELLPTLRRVNHLPPFQTNMPKNLYPMRCRYPSSSWRTRQAMRDCSDQSSMNPGEACCENSPPDSNVAKAGS